MDVTTARASDASRTPAGAAPPPHVVLLAGPGASHLIPMAELARRLTADHGFAVTPVTYTNLSNPVADSAVLSSLPAFVATAALPAISLDDLPAGVGFAVVCCELMLRTVPHLRHLIHSMISSM